MKGFKAKIREIGYLRWLLVLSNWLFQGIIHADLTEKMYKISFTIFFTIIFYILLNLLFHLPILLTTVIAFFFAHTLNWIINGNLAGILIHRLYIGKIDKDKLFNYLEVITNRLEAESSILCAAVFGSISRGELKESSDVDISFIREKGILNGIRALRFFISEIRLANKQKIPLEAYLGDSLGYLKRRYSSDEFPVVLYDPEKAIRNTYEKYIELETARELNNLF